jgi:hypothetical protein
MEEHSSSRHQTPSPKPGRPLAREITVVLVVKVLVLCLLWITFFRAQPPSDPAHLLVPEPSNYGFTPDPSPRPSPRAGEGASAQESSS